jgi:hypothetical protein
MFSPIKKLENDEEDTRSLKHKEIERLENVRRDLDDEDDSIDEELLLT